MKKPIKDNGGEESQKSTKCQAKYPSDSRALSKPESGQKQLRDTVETTRLNDGRQYPEGNAEKLSVGGTHSGLSIRDELLSAARQINNNISASTAQHQFGLTVPEITENVETAAALYRIPCPTVNTPTNRPETTNKMALQLIELLTGVSSQIENVMMQNGIPAEIAKADVATFMRGGTGALLASVYMHQRTNRDKTQSGQSLKQ